jgi:hypothetical protein
MHKLVPAADHRAEESTAPAKSLIGLLDPHREMTGFVGRTPELAELLAWCADGQDAPVRLVVGSSGSGKTRLAVEFGHLMRTRGWRTQWLGDDHGAGPGVVQRKSLLIIDDADHYRGLAELLAAVTSAQPQARILLLARDAGSWCDQLELAGPVGYALIAAARSALITLTNQVADELTDAEISGLAVIAFAAELDVPSRGVQLDGGQRADRYPMLDLHIAALVAVAREVPGQPVNPDSATGELLALEQGYWDSTAERIGITAGPARLRQILAEECLFGPDDDDARTPAIASWLGAVFSSDDEGRGRLRSNWPEGVMTRHVAAEFSAAPEFARECLTDLDATRLTRAAALLASAGAGASDRGRFRPPDSALHLVAAQLEKLDAPNPVLVTIVNELPYPEAIWAKAGAAICDRIVTQLEPGTDQAIRGYWQNSLSARLWLAGRESEAVGAAEEAVRIRRDLAAQAPDRYLASLALTLSYLSIQYTGLGRAADALKVTEEAVGVRRRLAAADPDRYALLAPDEAADSPSAERAS